MINNNNNNNNNNYYYYYYYNKILLLMTMFMQRHTHGLELVARQRRLPGPPTTRPHTAPTARRPQRWKHARPQARTTHPHPRRTRPTRPKRARRRPRWPAQWGRKSARWEPYISRCLGRTPTIRTEHAEANVYLDMCIFICIVIVIFIFIFIFIYKK